MKEKIIIKVNPRLSLNIIISISKTKFYKIKLSLSAYTNYIIGAIAKDKAFQFYKFLPDFENSIVRVIAIARSFLSYLF